jgi:hypothetical protein
MLVSYVKSRAATFLLTILVASSVAAHAQSGRVALYNFLSTFSGTHFLTPRTYTAELGFHF